MAAQFATSEYFRCLKKASKYSTAFRGSMLTKPQNRLFQPLSFGSFGRSSAQYIRCKFDVGPAMKPSHRPSRKTSFSDGDRWNQSWADDPTRTSSRLIVWENVEGPNAVSKIATAAAFIAQHLSSAVGSHQSARAEGSRTPSPSAPLSQRKSTMSLGWNGAPAPPLPEALAAAGGVTLKR